MKPKTIVRVGAALLLCALCAATARAQASVNEKRPAAADGVVAIDVLVGAVDVKGWANKELQVTGTVTPSDKYLKITGDPRNLQVKLVPEQGVQASANLQIQVPVGCTVRIKGVNTSIRASGITGTVAADAVEGDVTVSDAAAVELSAVKGKIDLSGSGKRARVQAVNGSVTVKGGGGEISVSTVTGPVAVSGDGFDHVRLNTVSGPAEFDGKLSASASLSAESISGTIKLTLAGAAGADVTVNTMSGKIENGLSGATPAEPSHGPRQTFTFSIGGGGAKVTVQTLSGAIVLSKR